ncbi:hypothetical protein BD311DRAFT_771973 [Dichomitus squalens]|uniref:Uncharacterized protein n=1 Tax=Dichomitus squalens TaxID=114155 RepID=A0A4Q9M642_9APHY|nr:hypothetical protein BD311DRAFT_771973 [Dichomitus squalens]
MNESLLHVNVPQTNAHLSDAAVLQPYPQRRLPRISSIPRHIAHPATKCSPPSFTRITLRRLSPHRERLAHRLSRDVRGIRQDRSCSVRRTTLIEPRPVPSYSRIYTR